MITLSNLHEQSLQDVFNYIANHLLTQNKKSQTCHFNCAYKGENNTKCAVGCIVSSKEYRPSMEGKSSTKIINDHNPLVTNIDMLNMLRDLQILHDGAMTVEWPAGLNNIAAKYKLLTYDIVLPSGQSS